MGKKKRKMKPFMDIGGVMFGISIQTGPDDDSSQYSELDFERKPNDKYIDKVWIKNKSLGGAQIVIVHDIAEALPIITRQHKPWCPFCNSPKCMQDSRVVAEAFCSFPYQGGRWVGEYYFHAYRCKRFKHYFLFTLTTVERKSIFSSTAIKCSRCDSKTIILSDRAIGLPKPRTEQNINLEYILRFLFVVKGKLVVKGEKNATQVELFHYRCINCRHSEVIAFSKNKKGKVFREEFQAKDMQTAKNIMSENLEYYFYFDD